MDAWHWSQWVLAAVVALELALAAVFNGRPRPPISVTTKAIDLALIVALTWAGGFWS